MSETNLIFQPHLNILRISHRKIKKKLGWLILLFLFLLGIYSIFYNYYLSILIYMFLFYSWQRKKEKIIKLKMPKVGQEIEISSFLDKEAKDSLEKAWMFCYRNRYNFLRPIHLFSFFIKQKDFKKILKRLNCEPNQVIKKTKKILKSSSFFPDSEKRINVLGPQISQDFREVFIDAYLFCLKERKEQISSLDILWAISQNKNLVGMIFDEFGISPNEVEKVIKWAIFEKEIKKYEQLFFWRRLLKPKGKLDRAMTAALTPTLDMASNDLTYMARQGAFEVVIGREREINDIFNFFSAGQTGIILVGHSTIGKKAILKKIAQLMVSEDVPKFLKDKRLVKLNISNLVGLEGARDKGEEYLKKILFEVSRAGNIVLVIEGIDNLVGLKSQRHGLDFSEILASALSNSDFFFIGTTSLEGFSLKIEGKTLGSFLSKIDIENPDRDSIWQILISKIFVIEKKLNVLFSVDAVEQAINLADKYIYGNALPAKAMDLLAEAAYRLRGKKSSVNSIKEEHIIELVVEKTNIPMGEIQDTEKEKLLNLEKLIHERVVNQEEAVQAAASALRRSRVNLKDRKKTICNFLFVGPTGVGKTEVARTLARVYFGSEKKMVRLDMSEYQEKRGLRRLIGMRSDQGVENGYLTEAIKRQPYSLLLLDEIEKAHPDILNLFLQVMDEGRLTDASGETINFTNVILIATSNAGTKIVQERVTRGVIYQAVEKELKEEILPEYFRPEFLNRFDRIVLFKPLTEENMIEITHLFLNMVKKGMDEKGVIFEIEKEAVEELAQAGYNPLYGARSLSRVIQEKVENNLARLFLEKNIKRRDKIILKKGMALEIQKAPKL
ncbi:MAG: ATP-dependent Clp protease ATP-binding subunit [Patescibacteria group bacterium]|nr:ATP-dependent Clp protease ATP-binding subunit [Patescibacteria group bacterium]